MTTVIIAHTPIYHTWDQCMCVRFIIFIATFWTKQRRYILFVIPLMPPGTPLPIYCMQISRPPLNYQFTEQLVEIHLYVYVLTCCFIIHCFFAVQHGVIDLSSDLYFVQFLRLSMHFFMTQGPYIWSVQFSRLFVWK